ncbi:MAG TPA: uracil-DNA glycosylase family protein, partial [Candidatus Limnocylindrales bacterium]|nr:uracil-DNA glycosylase family protein [Candidatus Limnocylindrales bacterium]
MIDLTTLAPKRLRHAGDWPTPTPRRAPAGTELRALQDAMPRCASGAPPVLSGDGSERAMLIGQAPGWREIETGLPFAWDAGKRLCGWLASAGIGVEDFRGRWYVTSVGKCYPGRAPGSSVDRPPSQAEIQRWSPY